MRTAHLLRARQEAGGEAKILTHLVLHHPGANPLPSDQAAIQADVVALHARYGRDIEVVAPLERDGLVLGALILEYTPIHDAVARLQLDLQHGVLVARATQLADADARGDSTSTTSSVRSSRHAQPSASRRRIAEFERDLIRDRVLAGAGAPPRPSATASR
jgi:hypothetical protein